MINFLRNFNLMSLKWLVVFGFIISLVLLGCNKEIPEKRIDSDILVSAKYKNGKVCIEAETEKNFQCINYTIKNSIHQEEKIITIDFTDVAILGIRLIAFGPAKAEINLDELELGDYVLKFVLDGITTKAELKVDSQVSLELLKAGNVILK